jgi:hypothetical protein
MRRDLAQPELHVVLRLQSSQLRVQLKENILRQFFCNCGSNKKCLAMLNTID